MKPDWNLSICGLNCAQCDMYVASHGDEKLRQEIAEWFKTKRNRTLNPDEIRCEGCRGPVEANWSSDCKMMQCAKKRRLEYCFQCKDFPCETVNAFASDGVAHHKRTIENMKQAKTTGLSAWIVEQKRKGAPTFCP
jgi:hypothetical protein